MMNCKHLAPWHHCSEVWQYVDVLRFRYLHVHMSMHHTRLPHLRLNSCKMKPPVYRVDWWKFTGAPQEPQQEHKWNNLEHKWHTDPRSGTQLTQDCNTCHRSAGATRLEHPPSRVMERNWDTSGTQPRHSWCMHHKWRRHLRVSPYKMESPDP